MSLTNMSNVRCVVADSESQRQIDLTPITTSLKWEETLLDQPGKLDFTYLESGLDKPFMEGSNVVVSVKDRKVFDGYVFKRKRTEGDTCTCTAFDRLRYLNNKDTKVFDGATPTEIFSQLCSQQGLPFKITNGSNYKTAPCVHDNKSLYSMIIQALDEAMVATGQYLIVRDDVGTLEMIDIANMTTNLLIGDGSLLTGFNYSSSIDQDTYNYIKLIQENKDTKKRELYVAMDSANIAKWGRLQYFEKMDEKANAAQIIARANQLLKLYNRKTRSLSVSCIGDIRVRAGCGVGLAIEKLRDEGVPYMQMVFCSKVAHSITRELHTMDLTLEVV